MKAPVDNADQLRRRRIGQALVVLIRDWLREHEDEVVIGALLDQPRFIEDLAAKILDMADLVNAEQGRLLAHCEEALAQQRLVALNTAPAAIFVKTTAEGDET